jgi:hypothetical protein
MHEVEGFQARMTHDISRRKYLTSHGARNGIIRIEAGIRLRMESVSDG